MSNKAKNRGFKVNHDGRLIIKADDNGAGGNVVVESDADSDKEIIDNKSRNVKKKEKN